MKTLRFLLNHLHDMLPFTSSCGVSLFNALVLFTDEVLLFFFFFLYLALKSLLLPSCNVIKVQSFLQQCFSLQVLVDPQSVHGFAPCQTEGARTSASCGGPEDRVKKHRF